MSAMAEIIPAVTTLGGQTTYKIDDQEFEACQMNSNLQQYPSRAILQKLLVENLCTCYAGDLHKNILVNLRTYQHATKNLTTTSFEE